MLRPLLPGATGREDSNRRRMAAGMMTVKPRLRVSTAMLLAGFALTLYVGAQQSLGDYPALPQYPINGARYVFRPPAGWHRTQTTAIGLGVWVYPGESGYTQNISVRAENHTG